MYVEEGEGTLKSKLSLMLAVFFFLSIALISRTQAIIDNPEKSELISGVKTIRNPNFPKIGRFELVLSHELTIGDKGTEQNYIIGKTRDIKVDDEGSIYVGDFGEKNIKVFNSKGNLLRIIGQPGQGPGDINSPFFFVVFQKGNIAVYDMYRNYVSFFNNMGKYVSGFKLEDDYRCSDFSHFKEWLFFEKRSLPEINIDGQFVAKEVNKTIFRTDFEGKSRHTYGKFRGRKIPTKANNQNGTVTTIILPGSYTTAWAIDKTGRLFVGYNKEYKIDVYDDKGTLHFRFERNFSPRIIPNNIKSKWEEKYYPAYEFWHTSDIIFDDEGNSWFRQPWIKKDRFRKYDVFSPSGIYLKQIVVPHLIYQIKRNKVYCILKSEEGFDIIVRFGITQELKLSS